MAGKTININIRMDADLKAQAGSSNLPRDVTENPKIP